MQEILQNFMEVIRQSHVVSRFAVLAHPVNAASRLL